jgi:hypothetical protein
MRNIKQQTSVVVAVQLKVKWQHIEEKISYNQIFRNSAKVQIWTVLPNTWSIRKAQYL